MAKRKDSAPNIPAQTLARARAELYGSAETPSPVITATTPQVNTAKSAKTAYKAVSIDDLRNEYVYVLTDIRNMFLLAALLFVGLVVVSLVVV